MAHFKTEQKEPIENDIRKESRFIAYKLEKFKTTGKHDNFTIEAIRKVSELVILCDRKRPELIEYIVESGIFESISEILEKRSENKAMLIQILQTYNIIINGVEKEELMHYLLFQGIANAVMVVEFDIQDEEVLGYYTTFLKALSFKLNKDTVDLFCDKNCQHFPLYWAITKLFDSNDYMAIVAVKTVMLNILKVRDERIDSFIEENNRGSGFFLWIIRNVREKLDDIIRMLCDSGRCRDYKHLESILEDHIEILSFINDLMSLGSKNVVEQLIAEFHERLTCFTYSHYIEMGNRDSATPPEFLSYQASTIFLTQTFSVIKHKAFLEYLVTHFFVDRHDTHNISRGGGDGGDGDSGERISIESKVVSNEKSYFELHNISKLNNITPWLCLCLQIARNPIINNDIYEKTYMGNKHDGEYNTSLLLTLEALITDDSRYFDWRVFGILAKLYERTLLNHQTPMLRETRADFVIKLDETIVKFTQQIKNVIKMDTCRAGEVFQAIVNIVEISEEKLLEIVTNNSSRLLFSQPLQPANDPFWEYSVLFNNTNVKRREIDELESNSSLLSSLVTRLYYMERWKEKLTHQPEETKVLDLEVSQKDAVEDNLGYFPTQYTHIQVQPEKLIPVILIREPSKTNIFIPTKKSYSTRPGSNNTSSSISVIKDINKKYSLPRGYADSCAKPASSGGLGYANSNNIYTQQQSPVSATPRSLFMLPGINESRLIERFSPLKALSIKSFISNYLSFGTPPTGSSDFENANDTIQQQDRKQETKKSCSTSQTVDTNPSQLQATNGGSTSPTKLLFGENVELVQCFIYPYSDEYLLILLKPSFSQEKLDDDKYLYDSEQDQKYFVLYVFNTLDLFLLSKQQYSMPQSPTKAGTNFNEVGIYSALACISPTPKTHLSTRPKATTTTLPNLDCTAKYLPLYRKLKQTIARLGPSSSQPDFQCVNLWFKDSVDFEKTLDWVSKFKNHQRTTNLILKAVCGPG